MALYYALDAFDTCPFFGDYLRLHRKRYGELQKDLAAALGVKNTYISRVENGTRTFSKDLLHAVIQRYAQSKSEADLFHQSYDFTFLYETVRLADMTLDDRMLVVRLLRLLSDRTDGALRDGMDEWLHFHEMVRGLPKAIPPQLVDRDGMLYVGGYDDGILGSRKKI